MCLVKKWNIHKIEIKSDLDVDKIDMIIRYNGAVLKKFELNIRNLRFGEEARGGRVDSKKR